jgi:class 3 adenylate cyclase/tetratricopeptide (TPR) repeat protein
MKCPNCSTENAADSRFCENCGEPLPSACPNCGKPVKPGAKFCRNCGFNLVDATAPADRLADLQRAAPSALKTQALSARGQMEGERKRVTVLFTDIVGSTTLAEKLDPEVWGEIVTGAHQCVSKAVYRYEGTIAQLLGDGVLAFFGAPLAHEDDAERAIRAGLDILTLIESYAAELRADGRVDNFQMRVGLNTGLVVVGTIGSDLHMEYLAVGDTVNLAARMQSAADPNTVLISENTYRLTAKLFDYEDRGRIAVKGKSEPVQVYRVLGERASGAVRIRGIEGLDSPLVGREREMQTLRSCIDELLRGHGQIVSVMGEAGLGKSRLMAEAKKRMLDVRNWKLDSASVQASASNVQSPTSNLQWFEGRSLSFETATPYTPFIDLFIPYFGLRGEASDADKYARIAMRVTELLPGKAAEITPFIATMLGIKFGGEDAERVRYLEPPQLRARTFAAVRAVVERMASMTPLILVFEDLHWADSTSLNLLEQLMPLTDQKMILLVALFRPLRQEPSWRFHEIAARDFSHRYTSIALEPLDEANARQLVANLLEIEDLPEKVRALILMKAEGNPFFVEEVIRSLLDAKLVIHEDGHWRATREIEKIALPDTLAGVIAARLDRLDEDAKRTAQAASVVGREFQYLVLTDISDAPQSIDPTLVTLQRRELVREKTAAPPRAYWFKHALTQETAYESILLSKRRELHRRVAECLERLAPDRVHDIARHFLQAQENARALPYLVQAGENAARAYSTPEAIGLFTRAIEIVQHVLDLALARRAYEGLGGALMLVFDIPRAVAHYHAMLAYAREHGDIPLQVSALNKLGMIEGQYMGQFEPAEQHLLEAERLAREFEHQPGLAELYTVRCGICTMKGDFGNAARYLTESAIIGRQLDLKEQEAFGETHTANTLTYMAEFEQAFAKSQDALKVSEEIGNQMRIAEIKLFPIPFYYLHKGDIDQARQSAEEGAQIAHRIGTAFPESLGLRLLAEIAHLRGEYESAFELLKRTDAAAQMSGLPFLAASTPAAVGSLYLEISDKFVDQTIQLHAQTLKQLENPMAASGASSAFADLGFCALAIGNIDTATRMFNDGLARPTILGLLEKPRYLVGLALVALAQNQLDDAEKRIQAARTYIDDRAMAYLEPFLDWADAQVSAARGDNARALERYARAEERALSMKMRPTVWQARAGAAALLAAMGRARDADAKRQSARAMIDEIATLFEDEKLKAMFVESAVKKLTKDG